MKIGIFDSGLGGLVMTKAIIDALPQYDYIYLGDTLHVPYGPRSFESVYRYTERAIDYLFEQDCNLIIIACNTASAKALRSIQQKYLPKKHPNRRVLGVIIPTVEAAIESGAKNIGMISTAGTKKSETFDLEFQKQDPSIHLKTIATPLLVPMIENKGIKWIRPILREYLEPLKKQEALILGCTHYPILKKEIAEILRVPLLSQDEIIPGKLESYLARHPEIETTLSKNKTREFLVTDLTDAYQEAADDLYGEKIEIQKVSLG
ncbi:MAG: glutamate racemase [Alphaproteobacteria bacterium]|nr:glutamate racemase [Alphaproteobacteria bacterium]MBN2780098.1 glutamate racemase [Alphaproteobacteria bacterium]